MTKFILTLLLVALSNNTIADWSLLTRDEQDTNVYVDETTIRRSKSTVKMWTLLDFATTQVVAGVSFQSGRSQKEYNCRRESTRILSMSFHSGRLGLGKTVHTESVPTLWVPISPTSVEEELFKFVCKSSVKTAKTSGGEGQIVEWVRVESTAKAITLYDPKSIVRSNGSTNMLVLTNFSKPVVIEGKQHQSAMTRFEYDCVNARSRSDGGSFYSLPDRMGAPIGTEPASNDWYSIEPNSHGKALWTIACGKSGWLSEMSKRLEDRIEDKDVRNELLKIVHYEARRVRINPQVVLSLINVTSGFRKYAVTPNGARGFMLVSPSFVSKIGLPEGNLFHTRQNIRHGCVILRYFIDLENGDLLRALERYRDQIGERADIENEPVVSQLDFPKTVERLSNTRWSYDGL